VTETLAKTSRRQNSRGMSGHHRPNRGHSVEYLTPPEIVGALGSFDLDPACPPRMPWRTAVTMWTRADNAIDRVWHGRVFLNPPYGAKELGIWLKKLADHGDGIALVFARTETEAFFLHAWRRANAMLFIRGRLHFHRACGSRTKFNSGAPSVLIAYGQRNARALRSCGIKGQFVNLYQEEEAVTA
jgi:hypothetical protein